MAFVSISFAYLYHIYLSAFRCAKHIYCIRIFDVAIFEVRFFLSAPTRCGTPLSQAKFQRSLRFSSASWDRLLTTRRSQGVKSKYWNNKNYLFLCHILSHSTRYRPNTGAKYTNRKWISLPTLKYWMGMGTVGLGYDQRIGSFLLPQVQTID